MIYGLEQIAQDGLGWTAALAVAAGVAVAVGFLRRQRVLADPLLDLRLFRAPAFSVSVASMYAAVFLVGGIFLFVAQYLQLVLGKGPLEAGLWLLPSTGGLVLGSMLAPLIVVRARAGLVLAGGLGLLAAAREAFTGGLEVAAVTGAVLVAALAVGAAILLRHVHAGEPQASPAA